MRKFFATLLVVFGLCDAVHAAPLVGSISLESESLETSGPWASSAAVLSWEVLALDGGLWDYRYRASVFDGGVSYLAFQADEFFLMENVITASPTDWNVGQQFLGFDTFWGIGFANLDCTVCEASFTSNYAPKWTAFGALGVNGDGSSTFAYNSNFGGLSDESIYNTPPAGFVLGPGGVSPIPEPATTAMMLMGLLGLVGFCRKKKVG